MFWLSFSFLFFLNQTDNNLGFFFGFFEVHLDSPKDGSSDLDRLRVLRQKIEVTGINLDDSCVPGRYHYLICPKVPTRSFCSVTSHDYCTFLLSDEKSLLFFFFLVSFLC